MNYLAHDESDAQAVYGPNYTRLQELKRKYDPENFFHTNVNIGPCEVQVPRAAAHCRTESRRDRKSRKAAA